jgi:replicative DNA helicase
MQENLYNLAFERSILSSIVFEPAQFDELSSALKIDDFYLPAHQGIFNAMLKLLQKDQPIDEEFIKKELVTIKKFDEQVMLEILSANPISNTKAYVEEIKDKSLKRHLLTLTTEIKRVTVEEELPSAEVVDIVEKKLYEITQDNQTSDFKDSPQMTFDTMEYIKEMKARGNSVLVGVDTGFNELNRMTTGFGKGDLVIIAARPAMGKTSFVLNTVNSIINQGKGVAFFSLEMPAEQLMMRMLASLSRVDQTKIRTGQLDDEDWARISSTMGILMQKKNMYIDDSSGLTPTEVRSRARRVAREHGGLSMIMVDYLQLMRVPALTDNRTLEIAEISRSLKALAKELNVPVVALSQLNRSLEQRADKRPVNSDLRESGSIEQDADLIMFIYRDEVYHPDSAYKGTAEIIIGKQRNGPIGSVRLTFQGQHSRFDNYAGPAFDIDDE